MSERTNSAFNWSPVTPSDSNVLEPYPTGLFIGGAGTVRLMGHDGVSADFVCAAGTTLTCQPLKVMATGTTATNIVEMRN